MIMGGDVAGGKIYGDYPSLYDDNPLDVGYGRGSLIPTTSCDEYFAELAQWFGVSNSELSTVFPNIRRFYSPSTSSRPVGFMGAGEATPDQPSSPTTPIPATTPGPDDEEPGKPMKTLLPYLA